MAESEDKPTLAVVPTQITAIQIIAFLLSLAALRYARGFLAPLMVAYGVTGVRDMGGPGCARLGAAGATAGARDATVAGLRYRRAGDRGDGGRHHVAAVG